MNKTLLFGLLIIFTNCKILIAQTVDLSSVDEFFKVTSILKAGKSVTNEQWDSFDNSAAYRKYALRENQTFIEIIKSSLNIAYGKDSINERNNILNITKEEMIKNTTMLLKKRILINYIEVDNHYDSILIFRQTFDFNALIENAKQRLSSFIGMQIDSTTKLKPIYFFFVDADGGAKDDGLYIDFNLFFKQTDKQRINFLAHEFFHDFREKFENHDFNYKCDLYYILDMIQNEGIADMIDKSEGYKKYFSDVGESDEMVEIWVNLYNQAPSDLEKLQNEIVKYARKEISETEMIDELIEIVKFNGHHIGFYMANQILDAGYESEMLDTFYNPYWFYVLYNKSAKLLNLFQLSDEFMDYLRSITKGYYH
ncbi:MAG: hypothetical protein M0Q41_08435 [Bacteroidales bacterium]|nr:hypothetical protein [Acholeplasmataceae bacterium]MCK9448992.1 hypothetical protein [Bacteroidales bacterium]